MIEYGDYECPLLRADRPAARASCRCRRVFRHFPVVVEAPARPVLAHAAEAARRCRAASGRCTTRCSPTRATSTIRTCGSAASELGLDLERFDADRRSEAVAERVTRDFRSGIRAGVMTTPTLFVDGELFGGLPGPELLDAPAGAAASRPARRQPSRSLGMRTR